MADEAEPAQSENAQAKTTWVRNCTPDHLRLHVGGTLLVFAPLQRRQLSVNSTCYLEPLVQQGVLACSTPTSDRFDKLARLIEALPVALAVGFVAALLLNGWLGVGALIAFGLIALVLIIVAVLVASFGSSTVARLVGQLVMLSLVVVISIGVPALVLWRYGLDDLETGNPLSELARMLLVVFIALACMVPGLLFFLFDRQRLSTLRARFEQQIFRLDPRVTTLADVEARYGNQLDEMYGQNGSSATARLARQGRWPIPLATVVLAFGWILTLLPVKSDPPPASLADVALSFAPAGQHRGLRLPRRLLLRDQPHSPPLCPRRSPPQGLQHHHGPRDRRRSAGLARQGRRTGLAAGGTPRRGLPHRHRPGDVPDLPPGGLSRQVGPQGSSGDDRGAGPAEEPGRDRSLRPRPAPGRGHRQRRGVGQPRPHRPAPGNPCTG